MMDRTDASSSSLSDLEMASDNWGWILAAGVGVLILGIIALFDTVATTVISTITLGILLLIGAVVQVVLCFRGGGAGLVILRLLLALLFLLGGLALLFRPVFGAATLTFMLGLFFLFSGAAYILYSVVLREGNWGWAVVTGVLGIILGILMLAHWPVSGLYAIGLFVAIYLILTGFSMIVSSVMLHSARPMLSQPAS
jgi:uncharacterized membrane protein HdeD (DUF308 family)